MANGVTLGTQGSASLDAQSGRVLTMARSEAVTGSASSKQDTKIEKAGKDFESILLANWLQQAEQSFAKVPGGDSENGDDDDSSKDQFQGIAMQALAGSIVNQGGIGIAKMVTQHLRLAANSEHAAATEEQKIAIKPRKTAL
jgi:Rod binding domain-containing protein